MMTSRTTLRARTTQRVLIGALAVVLALGGLGIASVSASGSTPDAAAARQDDAPAWLGISIRDSDDGVVVARVERDSPADDAGLMRGDIVAAVDGDPVADAAALVEMIQGYEPGDEITLTVTRDGEDIALDATLGEYPATLMPPEVDIDVMPGFQGTINLLDLQVSISEDGLLIENIDADSPFADSGLQEGDLITGVNGESLSGPRVSMGRFMMALRFDEPVVFDVIRDGEAISVEVNLDLEDAIVPMLPEDMPDVMPGQGPGMMVRQGLQLGVAFQTLTAEIAADLGLDVEQGALITDVVADSPAADAGLLVDDIVTAIEGDPVDEQRTLRERLYAYDEGETVTLTLLRDGEEMELDVVLGPNARNTRDGFGRGPGGMYWFDGMPHETMPYNQFEDGRGRGHGMGPGMYFYGPDSFDSEEFERFMDDHPFLEEFFQMMPDGMPRDGMFHNGMFHDGMFRDGSFEGFFFGPFHYSPDDEMPNDEMPNDEMPEDSAPDSAPDSITDSTAA